MRRTFPICFAVAFTMPVSAASPLTRDAITGIWKEKSGDATYTFGEGYNFEYHRAPNLRVWNESGDVDSGIWTVAAETCSFGAAKGNLYIQAGTERCCHNAYFLGK